MKKFFLISVVVLLAVTSVFANATKETSVAKFDISNCCAEGTAQAAGNDKLAELLNASGLFEVKNYNNSQLGNVVDVLDRVIDEEVQMILIVQASFFGGSIAFRKRGHVVVDILVDTFSPKMQRFVSICTWILVFAALILIGSQEGIRTYRQIINGRVTNILKIPMWIDWAGVTIATLLMTINHIYVGIEDFIKGRRESK